MADARMPLGRSGSDLGDPMEAWKARGRELNEIYTALSRVVRDTIGNHSEGGRYTGDAIEDIQALGAEVQRLRAALQSVIWNDGTLGYEYGEGRAIDGVIPAPGTRWLTPREIARDALELSRKEGRA